MLKYALAVFVVAAAIDATQAASHSADKTTCDQKCENDFKTADGTGRERRAGHAAVKAACLAGCQTDFEIADVKEKCDAKCQNEFDGRSRRAGHAFEKILCEARCTHNQTVSLAAQAKGVCTTNCQADFTKVEDGSAHTTEAGDRSRRAEHAMKKGTCDAGCANTESTAKKTACDNLCDAEFDKVQSKEDAAAAKTFCADYDTTCGGETVPVFAGDNSDAKKATCEAWYLAADAGTDGDTEVATRACYEYHLSLAKKGADQAAIHCDHARGNSKCKAGRNRRAGHSDQQVLCKELCKGTFDTEEKETARALEEVKVALTKEDKKDGSSGSFASSAAAIVIAGLAAALN